MNVPSIQQIKDTLIAKGYQYFDDGQLNIIGIRAASPVANTFDDLLCLIYTDGGVEHYHYMACTTKPGLYYLDNPDNVNGVAIVCPGQYVDVWVKGMHKGQYPALAQYGTFKVYRDNDRNGTFDYSNICDAGPECGIECHHASNNFPSIEVNNWSAGCQVVADPKSFAFLMQQVDASVLERGNQFTYTLIGEGDL